ncbi:hypothetical protein AS038_02740 [Arthrobacter sp. NIO-1057]|nr:hypothetical protein AS038_02740 [Arthrobacter sp. NIO-1057]
MLAGFHLLMEIPSCPLGCLKNRVFEVLLVRAAPTGSILHVVFVRSSSHKMMYYKYVILPLPRPQDLWIFDPV